MSATSVDPSHDSISASLDHGGKEADQDPVIKNQRKIEDRQHEPKNLESTPAVEEPEPEPPKRKLTKAFSFLTRTGSIRGKSPNKSPSAPASRKDAATVNTIAEHNPAVENGKTEDSSAIALKKADRNSLKDRFKLLRMQEEAGIKWVDEPVVTERPSSSGQNKAVDVNAMLVQSDDDLDRADGVRQRTTSMSTSRPTLNQSLKPGTAAGTSAGPSEQPVSVDWDLWQAVVYEGPGAVARTSATELNEAIAQGIPSAIRGVVWQVLAQSQNEQLESLYNELASRSSESSKSESVGSSNELRPVPTEIKRNRAASTNGDLRPRPTDSKRHSATSVNGGPPERERESGIISSASSMHSAVSSPPSEKSEQVVIPSPSAASQDATSSEAQEKAQAKLHAEQAKRLKDETHKLQKLERTIKRDLGARTSYSKFLMSAGLQSGLYGICKAYALYDEEVGYAQGMNFVAMPLLFNVSYSLVIPIPQTRRKGQMGCLWCHPRPEAFFQNTLTDRRLLLPWIMRALPDQPEGQRYQDDRILG